MKYKCIIFDCDGVLVDSEEISNLILVEMANALGANIDLEYALQKFVGNRMQTIYNHIETLIKSDIPKDFGNEYRNRTAEAFKTQLKPIKGVHDLLDKITVPHCVASSGTLDKIRMNLITTNLIDKFKNKMYSCYEINSWKPNPDIFLYAAKKMGFKPEECAVIEDSLPGIKAARNGGFDVFGFTTKSKKDIYESEGAMVFYEMKDLFEMINRAE